MLINLLYHSRAAEPMSSVDLGHIIRTSRKNNRQQDITGILLYNGGHFLQLLEGEYDRVMRLQRRIKQDPRHTEYTQVFLGDAGLRLFPQWNMGLVNMERGGLDFDPSAIRDTLIDPATGKKVDMESRGRAVIEALQMFQSELPEAAHELVGSGGEVLDNAA